MDFNELCVLFVLAVCCFAANVLHGLTGCGSILVLHVLWQTAATIAPGVLHGTVAFADGDVKGIAEFSYVLTFFIQLVLTILLLIGERQKRVQQLQQGLPAPPSRLNGVLLLAFIPCSLIGAAIGVYTMPSLRENGSRIILGGSSLFFALTFLSLYQMKYLERKKTEDIIRDDLTLMRMQTDVQRHVILQYLEEEKRWKLRRERHRRRHLVRRAARKAAREQQRAHRRALLAAAATAAPANGTAGLPISPLVVVPPGAGQDADERGIVGDGSYTGGDGAPLEDCTPDNAAVLMSGGGPLRRIYSSSEVGSSVSRQSHQWSVHGPSAKTAGQHRNIISDVHLPDEAAYGGSPNRAHRRLGPLQRHWIKEVNVHIYIRHRLAELSRRQENASEEAQSEARVAAWTLRTMDGYDGDTGASTSPQRSISTPSHVHRVNSISSLSSSSDGNSSSSSSTSSDQSDSERHVSATASTAAGRATDKREKREGGQRHTLPHCHHHHHRRESKGAAQKAAAAADGDAEMGSTSLSSPTSVHGEADQRRASMVEVELESIDLHKSMALAAASAAGPQRVGMGRSGMLHIGLREAQQQQLATLRQLSSPAFNDNSNNEASGPEHHHRLIHFIRMDGGVVAAAAVSSFFSGLFGSYTGVADPPLIIFALAMDISVSELRINYAVSSVVPAALRAVVGIQDGFAETDLLVYYFVSVLFAWGGIALGLHIGHQHTVSHIAFMLTTLTTLCLVALLMLLPFTKIFLRLLATTVGCVIVVLAVVRQQRRPEHRRPPAPPNTPATAAEIAAFDQFWMLRSRTHKAFREYDAEGSVVSMVKPSPSIRQIGSRKNGTAQVPAAVLVPQALEDAPVAVEEEELISIVPVKASR